MYLVQFKLGVVVYRISEFRFITFRNVKAILIDKGVISRIIWLDNGVAVSYTHLDVYKRQVHSQQVGYIHRTAKEFDGIIRALKNVENDTRELFRKTPVQFRFPMSASFTSAPFRLRRRSRPCGP